MASALETAFLELLQQLETLKAICSVQAKLLQQLVSKDAHITEQHVSKPIQCTDAINPVSPESLIPQKGVEAPSESAMTDELYQPLKTEDKSTFSFDCDVQLDLNKDQYCFLGHQGDRSELAKYITNSDLSLDEREVNSNFALFIKTYAPTFPNGTGAGDNGIPTMSNIKFFAMGQNSTLSLSDIDEEIAFLHSKDISQGAKLEPQITNPIGIRGPAQSSWHPDYLSEDCPLSHLDDNISDVDLTSQICEFCQAVFPAGAATKGEYLQHITGHIE